MSQIEKGLMKTLPVFIFSVFFFISHFSWAQSVSNRMPKELLQDLITSGDWSMELDTNEELNNYLNLILNPNSEGSANKITDSIFTGPSSYPAKIKILRYYANQSSNTNFTKVEAQVMQRYIGTMFSILKLSQIQDYNQISDLFFAKIKNQQLKIQDLTPQRRLQYSKSLGSSHGIAISDLNGGKYVVNAFYADEEQILALDLSRPIGENLVTFAHEIVHAADPRIDTNRKKYAELTPQVEKILQQELQSEVDASLILNSLFFEQSKSFSDFIQQQRAQRQNQLKAEVTDLLQPQREILRQWIRAAIALTVENEYRAYSLSLAAYVNLKNKYQIFPPSREREYYLHQLVAGDNNFALNLSVGMNPFNRIEKIKSKLAKNTDKDFSSKLNKIISLFEYLYLQETESFIKESNTNFKNLIQTNIDDSSDLPEWTKPGKFDSPTNPYNTLMARLTLGWAIRFKVNFNAYNAQLLAMTESLYTQHAGILDLHDVTVGELKALNILYSNANPTQIHPLLQLNSNDLDPRLTKYFQTIQLESNNNIDNDFIDAQDISLSLIKLRLLKSLIWLDDVFPQTKNDLIGAKNFVHQLSSGLYDHEELDDKRAQEITNELQAAIKSADLTNIQLSQTQILMTSLSSIGAFAEIYTNAELTREFINKIQSAQRVLENLNVQPLWLDGNGPASFRKEIEKNITQFYSSIDNYSRTCSNSSLTMFFRLSRVQLSQYSFPLSMVCMNRELALVRQPGDYTDSFVTQVSAGQTFSKILSQSRKIKMRPSKILKGP